ncbi:MAG: radical SAM protein [Gammaproteobacteria bacterium]
MRDRFGREINYLRISVTDRCNLRCSYCVPEEGLPFVPARKILTFEEIVAIVQAASRLGINKVRLTGGEPLLRRDIVKLVCMLSKIDGILDLALTTNGILLANLVLDLKKAGLKRVNVSLDSILPEKFQLITRGGDVNTVFLGIDKALEAGLAVKINCVVEESPDEEDAMLVKKYADKKHLPVQFVRNMNFSKGQFHKVWGGRGGDCKNCNRLRLLSDGSIMPCLFSDLSFNTEKLGIEEAITTAILQKPERGLPCKRQWMCAVGG